MSEVFKDLYYKVALPVGLPDIAMRDDWMKSLSFYVTLKACFNNSCVYGYSSRSLELKLKGFGIKVSHNYISKHISILLKKGMAKKLGDNLILTSFKSLKDISSSELLSSKRIVIFTSKSIKEQNLILKGRFIKRHLQIQEFQIRRKLDAVLLLNKSLKKDGLTSDESKQLRKDNKEFGYGKREKVNQNLVLTIKNIQDIYGISHPSAQKLKSDLVKIGFIKSEFIKGDLVWYKPNPGLIRPLMESSDRAMFIHKGSIYSAPSCSISKGVLFTRRRLYNGYKLYGAESTVKK